MAKKRDRRGGLSTNRQQNRVEPSANDGRTGDSLHSEAKQDRRRTTILVLFFIVSSIISIVVYRTIQAPSTNPSLPYVYQRGLVKTDAKYNEILTENTNVSENTSTWHFTHPVLAYITPWNSRGYELAKTFNSKFTHISPVWYDLKSKGTKLVLEGRHNADVGWISDLRMKGEAQILPRVVLESIPMDLLKKKKQRDKAINLIIAECEEMDYDGIVLESWSRWAAYGVLHDPNMRNLALKFIQQLGQAMHAVSLERKKNMKQSLQLVYVIGPPHSENLQVYDFGPHDLRSLINDVDGFSLMTYDFSNPQNPGPNAPLKWVRSTLQILLGTQTVGGAAQNLASKIFVGINFYGNDFIVSGGGEAIVARDYLSLLEKHKPILHWEKNSAEHYFLYTDTQNVKHVVFYPSLMSISMRLDEARSWGVGISIWEIGQGLDYFFDIF